MKLLAKLLLFVSAYTPLFLIILIKNYYELIKVSESFIFLLIIIIGILFIIVSNVFLFSYLFGIVRDRSNRILRMNNTINKTGDTLNYLLPYIISLIGFKITEWQDLLSLFILLGIVFVIYINSNLILMNPLLNIFGFKFYGLELTNGDNVILISNQDIKNNISINPKRIDKGLYMLGVIDYGKYF